MEHGSVEKHMIIAEKLHPHNILNLEIDCINLNIIMFVIDMD